MKYARLAGTSSFGTPSMSKRVTSPPGTAQRALNLQTSRVSKALHRTQSSSLGIQGVPVIGAAEGMTSDAELRQKSVQFSANESRCNLSMGTFDELHLKEVGQVYSSLK